MPELSLIQLTCIEMKSKWEGIEIKVGGNCPPQQSLSGTVMDLFTVCDSNSLIHPDLIHPTSLISYILILSHMPPYILSNSPPAPLQWGSPPSAPPPPPNGRPQAPPGSGCRFAVNKNIPQNLIWDNWEDISYLTQSKATKDSQIQFQSSHIWPGGEFSRDALLDVDSFRHGGVFSLLGLQCVSRPHHRTGHLQNNFSSSEITDNLL